jgi:hypothetical protein
MITSRPELQTEINTLAAILAQAPIDHTVTYSELSRAIGRNVQTVARVTLLRARRKAEAENGTLFGTVTRVGVKRLPTVEAPSVAKDAMKAIGRKARRTITRLDNVTGNADPQTAQRISACRSQLGAVALASSLNSEKIIAATSTMPAGQPLPVGRVFDLLKA